MFAFSKALTALPALIATAAAAALPQTAVGIETPTTGGVGPLVPTEVDVMYYQAPWNPTSEGCGINKVSNGTIKANTCTPLCTLGISVLQIPEADCLFTVYKDTQMCTDANEIVSYAIGAGSGSMVCIDVGVFHGCAGISAGGHGGASGIWTCG